MAAGPRRALLASGLCFLRAAAFFETYITGAWHTPHVHVRPALADLFKREPARVAVKEEEARVVTKPARELRRRAELAAQAVPIDALAIIDAWLKLSLTLESEPQKKEGERARELHSSVREIMQLVRRRIDTRSPDYVLALATPPPAGRKDIQISDIQAIATLNFNVDESPGVQWEHARIDGLVIRPAAAHPREIGAEFIHRISKVLARHDRLVNIPATTASKKYYSYLGFNLEDENWPYNEIFDTFWPMSESAWQFQLVKLRYWA